MPTQIEIPDNFFKDDETERLKALFGVTTEGGFKESLNKVILAALEEYRDMFLGMGLPSRADEIREYRLFYLIKRYFNGRIPEELEVSSLFQLPESRSRNLILYVLTRFHFDLVEELANSLRGIIETAQKVNDGKEYWVFIQSKNMVDELDKMIGRCGVQYKKLSKVRNESNMYIIAPDSYVEICKRINIKPRK